MRTIKFRGKTKESQWIIGSYFCMHHNDERDHIHYFIIPENTPIPKDKTIGEIQTEVQENTIGQFTRLHDKNSKEIYEGDIIQTYDSKGKPILHEVYYLESEARFAIKLIGYDMFNEGFISQKWINELDFEVIGNIFDNQELLQNKFIE